MAELNPKDFINIEKANQELGNNNPKPPVTPPIPITPPSKPDPELKPDPKPDPKQAAMPNVVANPQFFDRDKDGNIKANNEASKLGGVVSSGPNGTNGKIEASQSWDIGGNPIKGVVTTTPGQPIITTTTEALNFENGMLKIPANTNKDPNTTSTTTFNISSEKGNAKFDNGLLVVFLGSDGKPRGAKTANPDGTITVDSKDLDGIVGIAFGAVPDGLNNPLFRPGTKYDVRENTNIAHGGYSLFDENKNEVKGHQWASANLLTSVDSLNPGGHNQIEITKDKDGKVVIRIEDISYNNKGTQDISKLGKDSATFDKNDGTGFITAKKENTTKTPTVEVTTKNIVDPTTPYTGVHVAGQTNGENFTGALGGHVGVKKSDVKVNKDGEIVPDGGIRPFVEGQINGGTNGTNTAFNVTGIAGANIGPAPSLERGVSGTVYAQGVVETDQESQGNIVGRANLSFAQDKTIFTQVKQGLVGNNDTTLEVGLEFNRTRAPYKPAADFDKNIDAAVKKYLQENPNNKDGTLIKLTDGSVTQLATPEPQGAGAGNGKVR